ncbi:IS110 family transposase [Spirochaetia bacterium]|nr:IS110 family transposase [Spirochaetia bacterium]
MEETKRRYVGIDLGKRTYTVAIVGKRGAVKLSNGKTTVEGRQALYRKLEASDKVALEAGNLAFIMAKELIAAVGCEVRVLNPSNLALIYGTMKKTDKEDALKLAHILEDYKDERLPVVPVPSEKEMQRRKLLSSYRNEQGSRNRALNRLHALFVHQGITTIVKKDLATAEDRADTVKALVGLEREEAEHLLDCLKQYEKRLEALEARMAEEAKGDKQIERLQTAPGVGPKVSFAFLAYLAVERFMNASQVSNYLGLVPRVYMSGDTVRYGRITKRGNGYMRALLVQAAWAITWSKNGGALRERYEYMTKTKGMSRKKAIVAIARRLAVLLYTMLKNETDYEVRKFKAGGKKEGEEIAQLALSA